MADDNVYTGALFPTDEAFDRLPEGLIASFFANPEQLKRLVDYHLITSETPDSLVWETLTTLEGSAFKVLEFDDKVHVAGATHDVSTQRNIATILSNDGRGLFTIDSIIFPDGLVPCGSTNECGPGSNCRWTSQPECNNNDDSPQIPTVIPYNKCRGIATCQTCSNIGGTCDSDAECCGNTNCGQSGCCATVGATCSQNSDCCTDECGSSSTCCIADGSDCTFTDQCCSGICEVDRTRRNHHICQPFIPKTQAECIDPSNTGNVQFYWCDADKVCSADCDACNTGTDFIETSTFDCAVPDATTCIDPAQFGNNQMYWCGPDSTCGANCDSCNTGGFFIEHTDFTCGPPDATTCIDPAQFGNNQMYWCGPDSTCGANCDSCNTGGFFIEHTDFNCGPPDATTCVDPTQFGNVQMAWCDGDGTCNTDCAGCSDGTTVLGNNNCGP
eukprot:TRINITY_DN62066_c0_g1_i1.p1 TRINITY_DN62066_c0_g1~~TRINITY_DN62066_c0_g1_i1.p1  ORF type:complete len:505 (-),score=39.37 TRINITY_DN62066_c0_g1_i1:255-1583(-)